EFNTDITALELTADIKVGWNIGNTLDATGGSGLTQETSWGNPAVTPELIQAVKDAGFNAVRIPTTWERQMDDNNVIREDWIARVQEIVDYAYSRDMYVILNMHHEEWYQPYADKEEEISAKMTACWTQIAERFKDYDEHLIFEGMNEPRWKNTEFEWNGGNDEGRQVVNHLNKVFVDAVRATGGNNQYRFLMVCPYAANSSESALSALEIPDDDRLIVSVHAYIPYSFALQNPGSDKWLASKPNCTKEINELADVLDRLFISKGQAVIVGECGAMNRENEEYRAQWAEYYFAKFKEIGVPCFWWDNGSFYSGETFGLFDRRTNEVKYPVLLEAMMKGASGESAAAEDPAA
ncbi:MAG: glycoside hydrolase family 5 protein, partial [Oscillospiraceae bacterium]